MTYIFSRQNYEERLKTLLAPEPQNVLTHNTTCILALKGKALWLSFNGSPAAGALGKHQGQQLCQALQQAKNLAKGFETLNVIMDSSGAHLKEPLEGLQVVNEILEMLWCIRKMGKRIQVIIPNRCYGGASILIGTAAHKIILGANARLGLIGSRITGSPDLTPNTQTVSRIPHLRRVTGSSAENYLSGLNT